MKRDGNVPVSQLCELEKGLWETNYSEKLLSNIIDFYYNCEAVNNYRYLTNCTYEEFMEMLKQDVTINNSKFITTDNGRIVSGVI